jgi:rhodanese-related sulfurtransferase
MNELDITAGELAERIGEVLIVDVREPYEWSAGHIEGSIHIPLAQLPARMNEIPRDRELVMLCRVGGRSAHAQQFLMQAGYERVRNLVGGIIAWARECDPAVRVV